MITDAVYLQSVQLELQLMGFTSPVLAYLVSGIANEAALPQVSAQIQKAPVPEKAGYQLTEPEIL